MADDQFGAMDSSIDAAVATGGSYIRQAIGRFLLRCISKLCLVVEDRVDHVVASASGTAGDLRTAVISHLRFYHVGGIAHMPQVDLLLSEQDWEILPEPHPEREWVLRDHIEVPSAEWQQIALAPTDDPLFDGIHDVAGDGSMIPLPTPDHTASTVSMLIRQKG